MTRRSHSRLDQIRQSVAQEAARIMAEHGVEDYFLAKRKAAEKVGVVDTAALPRNSEIEVALSAYRRLFDAKRHISDLVELRSASAKMMRLLKVFQPRLVGSVLTGSASAHSEINLHVFSDQAENVSMALHDRGIDHSHAEKKLRYENDRYLNFPSFKFIAGTHAFEIVVLPENGIRQAPLSPIDGKPMQRASLTEVELLLKE
jgi:hypothetical protein